MVINKERIPFHINKEYFNVPGAISWLPESLCEQQRTPWNISGPHSLKIDLWLL